MPLGFERINERSQRPNALINFIRPLEGPDRALSEDYLNRIAAQCYPVMKANHISVMTLAEHEHNNEFLGRNFNAGECIELVLKDKSGRWLGFKYVQMVMMHELAHCKQMNHSKYFWQVRNQYGSEMEALWARKYLGEGVWGRGQNLTTGHFVMDRVLAPGDVPQHLCGGTFRRRGRKRKRGGATQATDEARPTYAERQQKRIQKKFGKHGDGNALGEDEMVRGALEQGHRHQGKPRVAGSKRGRELRAQAALARFEAANSTKQTQSVKDDDSDVDWSDSETEDEDAVVLDNGFVKVCGDEDGDDDEAQNEMLELQALTQDAADGGSTKKLAAAQKTSSNDSTSVPKAKSAAVVGENDQRVQTAKELSLCNSKAAPLPMSTDRTHAAVEAAPESSTLVAMGPTTTVSGACPICSVENETGSLRCVVCSHVLRPALVKGSWHCLSASCADSVYLNAGDVGLCGACGAVKPKTSTTVSSIAPGVLSADLLRWD